MRPAPALLVLTLLSALAISAVADDGSPNYSPPLERGFMPDKVYQIGDIDHIDLFSRSLTLTIPIGPSFRVGSQLQYGLMLAYSTQGWDIGYDYRDVDVFTKAEVSKLWNAGMGWRLSMGGFLAWNDPDSGGDGGDRWIGPDGSSHAFHPSLHRPSPWVDLDPSVSYTRDGSYLRLIKIDNQQGSERVVQFPDGSSQTFVPDPAAGQNKWRLKRGDDVYGNSSFEIQYLQNPNRWVISDSDGRQHTVYTGVNGIVTRVELDSLGQSATGTQEYVFHHMWTSIKRNCQDNRPEATPRVMVNLLTRIDLPDGSAYSMLDASLNPSYHLECSWVKQQSPLQTVNVDDLPGIIKSITLPTGGQIEWETFLDRYNSWEGTVPICLRPIFPEMCYQENVNIELEWAAIGTRRVRDAAGSIRSEWRYASAVPDWPGPGVGCGNSANAGDCHIYEERVVVVTDPTGNDTAHYFRGHPDSSLIWTGEYGLANTRRRPDPSNPTPSWENPPRSLSEQYFQGTVEKVYDDLYHVWVLVFDSQHNLVGTPVRQVYRSYRSDTETADGYTFEPGARYTNRHLVSERTVLGDDGGRFVMTTHKGFDGFGNFRTTVGESDFTSSSTVRTMFTGYNPSVTGGYLDYRHAPPAAPVEIDWGMSYYGSPWILRTFDRTRVTEGGRTQGATFCFLRGSDPFWPDQPVHPLTGFLRARRVLVADQSSDPAVADVLSENDILTVFTRDSLGRVIHQENLGGALQAGAFPDECSGELTPVGSAEYRIDHTFTDNPSGQPAGSMRYTAAYYSPSAPFTFYLRDLIVDKLSGLVTSSQKGSGPGTPGLAKLYEYNSMGRLTAEKPAQGAWTTYAYHNASGITPASVDVRVRAQGQTSGATLAASTYFYDHLGRLRTTTRQLADDTWSKQVVEYDSMGRQLSVSQVQAATVADESLKTTQFKYDDLFGRLTRTTAPDGSIATLAYTGARESARTVSVGGQSSTTTETYDGMGRLVKVVEPITSSTSSTALYTYDVSGKLATVTQTATGTTATQIRTFTYDGAGQLIAETMPEITGTITYGGYDSRGNPISRSDAVNTLTFAYDRAERPVDVKETASSGQRVIKEFAYGTPSDGYGDHGNGLLRHATRHNYYLGLASPDVTTVKQTNVYNGTFGRVSQRHTEISGTMYTQPRTFTQSLAWTDLGLLDSQEYPHCTFAPCSTALPSRKVYHEYANGALTSVKPYYAQSIGYLPNGLPSVLTMPRRVLDVTAGATVTQTIDTSTWMARPATITARDAANAVTWGSGTFQYDGAANITAIGADVFTYDLASRLTGADLTVDGVTKSDDYTYDPFGNLTQVDRTDNGVSTKRKIAINDATNRFLSSCTAPPGGTCWKGSHDAAGNVTSLQQDASTLTFEYGSSNETRRSLLLGVEHRYAYDTAGERVAFWRSGEGTTFTLRDLSGKVLREVVDDGSGSWRWKEDYVWFGGLLLATVSADGGLKHYGVDHLGTPRVVTDRCGMAIARHDYYPYGEEATSTTQDAERMKFTGHERDFGGSSSTLDDLDYMHARMYRPMAARFLSVDPGRDTDPRLPQSWNLYAYGRNNPINVTDPTGQWSLFQFLEDVVSGRLLKKWFEKKVDEQTKPETTKTEQEKREDQELLQEAGIPASNEGAVLGTGGEKVAEGAREAIKEVGGPIVREVGSAIVTVGVVKVVGAVAKSVPVEKLIPARLRRNPSWDPRYASNTIHELEQMARQGDAKARGMAKLAKEAERLMPKVGAK